MALDSILLSFISLAFLTAGAPIEKRSISSGPVVGVDFPDPAFIAVGSNYYAFATNNGVQNVPVATSPDFNTWTIQSGFDALPNAGAWSDGADVWAPDVIQRADGSFLLYYAARTLDGSTHCIGTATSSSPQGPYNPNPEPMICPGASVGGAIDPAGFLDTDGTRYIVYKIDGNNVGHGGSCNNGNDPIVPTPIIIQQVSEDGLTPQGTAQQILVNDPAIDGPLVEAPSLTVVDGTYFLFYSSNCFQSTMYDISYAVSHNGVFNGGNQYTRASAPLLQTGTDTMGLVAPGGLTVGPDASKVVFMGDEGDTANVREMWTGIITVNAAAGTVSI